MFYRACLQFAIILCDQFFLRWSSPPVFDTSLNNFNFETLSFESRGEEAMFVQYRVVSRRRAYQSIKSDPVSRTETTTL